MNTKTRDNFRRLMAATALPATPTPIAHRCDEPTLAGTIDAWRRAAASWRGG
jgi:hypothetical protein